MGGSTTARDGSKQATVGDGELGDALRTWRDRLDPATVGLATGGTRRAAGLRREELALLAGMSVDYVVRLEQGRATSPSTQVLAALARALRLSDAECRHLFLLAGRPPPAAERVPARLTPGVRRLLEQLGGTPVSVYDAAWTLVAWNAPFVALMGDPAGLAERDRNVLWRHFLAPPERVTQSAEQRAGFEAASVADLRAATAHYRDDPQLWSLVRELYEASPRFAGLWDGHVVGVHASGTKTVHHPDRGPLRLDCDVLTVPDGDLRVVLYTAEPGSHDARVLGDLGAGATTTGSQQETAG